MKKRGDCESLNEHQERIGNLIKRVAGIPERIARHVVGWNPEQLQTVPIQNEWAAQDILAHLRAADDILTSRIYMVLARDQPPLVVFDERQWAEIARYASGDFASSLNLFTLHRAEVIAVLQNMKNEEWERIGIHEVLGKLSVFDIVQGLTEHEEEHCTQLEGISWE